MNINESTTKRKNCRLSHYNPLLLLLLLSVFLLAGCDEAIDITILHTNDIHSRLKTSPSDPYHLGGLARLRTLIDQRKAAHSNNPTILLDAGDWSEGHMYYAIDHGANMLRFLDSLGYDATVIGNHDFYNGPAVLTETIAAAHPRLPVLAANIDASRFSHGSDFNRLVLPTKIFHYTAGPHSVRIGVIGLTTFEVAFANYMKPVKITDPVSVATRHAQLMHAQGVDIILLLSHNNIDFNKAMARQVPWVTAVISGHTHLKMPTQAIVRNAGRDVFVVEAHNWGRFLGELNLSLNVSTKTVSFKDFKLIPITTDIEEHPATAQMIADEDRLLNIKFGNDVSTQILGTSNSICPQDDRRETVLANFLTAAYRHATTADASLEISSIIGEGIGRGPISFLDLYNIVPHIPNPLTNQTWMMKNLSLSGTDLRKILTAWYSLNRFNLGLGILSMNGIDLNYDSKDSNKIKQILVNGNPLIDTNTYRIAVHEGLLLAFNLANEQFGLHLNLSRLEDTGLQAWQAVAHYLSIHSPLEAHEHRPGRHIRTTGPDLGWEENDLAIGNNPTGGHTLHVTLHNDGLTESETGAHYEILVGTPNDPIHEGTAEEIMTSLTGDVPLPTLAAGGKMTIHVPWLPSAGAGVYPLIFRVKNNQSFDGNSNNDTFRVFQKEGRL